MPRGEVTFTNGGGVDFYFDFPKQINTKFIPFYIRFLLDSKIMDHLKAITAAYEEAQALLFTFQESYDGLISKDSYLKLEDFRKAAQEVRLDFTKLHNICVNKLFHACQVFLDEVLRLRNDAIIFSDSKMQGKEYSEEHRIIANKIRTFLNKTRTDLTRFRSEFETMVVKAIEKKEKQEKRRGEFLTLVDMIDKAMPLMAKHEAEWKARPEAWGQMEKRITELERSLDSTLDALAKGKLGNASLDDLGRDLESRFILPVLISFSGMDNRLGAMSALESAFYQMEGKISAEYQRLSDLETPHLTPLERIDYLEGPADQEARIEEYFKTRKAYADLKGQRQGASDQRMRLYTKVDKEWRTRIAQALDKERAKRSK